MKFIDFLSKYKVIKIFNLARTVCYFPIEIFEFYPVALYLFKVKNRNTTVLCEFCSKLTVQTPARRQ